MTGKGVRWGRDRLGRSEPAFLRARTAALPPPTCTARGRLQHHLQLLSFCCKTGHLLAVCFLRPVPDGASAGCVACSCLVLRAVFCLPCHLCLPCPLPSSVCPRSCAFVLCPVHSMCARIVSACLQAARLSCWQLQHGPAVAARAPVPFLTFPLFPAESMILGHGCSVNL